MNQKSNQINRQRRCPPAVTRTNDCSVISQLLEGDRGGKAKRGRDYFKASCIYRSKAVLLIQLTTFYNSIVICTEERLSDMIDLELRYSLIF